MRFPMWGRPHAPHTNLHPSLFVVGLTQHCACRGACWPLGFPALGLEVFGCDMHRLCLCCAAMFSCLLNSLLKSVVRIPLSPDILHRACGQNPAKLRSLCSARSNDRLHGFSRSILVGFEQVAYPHEFRVVSRWHWLTLLLIGITLGRASPSSSPSSSRSWRRRWDMPSQQTGSPTPAARRRGST